MEEVAAAGFIELSVRTPCWGGEGSLNDLVYRQPSGFARFVVEVREVDPVYAGPKELAALQRFVRCPLRQVAARH